MEPEIKDIKTDPVCGMDVAAFPEEFKVGRQDGHFYFCSQYCQERFKKNPDKFQKTPLIRLSNIWKVFEMGQADIKVLRGLNIHVWPGDFVVIIGASGSGKSTALNMMGLLDKPSSGQVFLRGQDVSLLTDEARAELRSKVFGFVFQQYNLIPWLTAYDNVALPLIFSKKKVAAETVEKSFGEIGLGERMYHRPFELSGGEQQRVALLRALINDPEIILGDEPTGNLDSATGAKILEMLIDLNKSQGKTLVVVTHDTDIAEKADQIIVLKDGHLVRNHRTHQKIYTE